jgi:tRNA (adenine22-N1)-methyltransferase
LLSVSARLEAVLDLLEPCQRLADVGTDHGLIPIAAVQRGIARRAIAADLREAPLRVARQNVARAGMLEHVSLLRADGLRPLCRGAVDAVVMAGVSGRLMTQLCDSAPEVLAGIRQLVLQPNKDVAMVRAWALAHGFHLRDERMVHERGHFFVVCAFAPRPGPDPAYGLSAFDETSLCNVGPLFLRRKDPLARSFCEQECARVRPLVEQGVKALEPELAQWQAACAYMR